MNTRVSASSFFAWHADWLFRQRYLIVVLFLLGRYALYATLGVWSEDFWEHSAVVRELMTHLWHPQHPQITLNVPHAFFSPYSLLVALFGLAFHLSSISALAIFGMFNLALFSYGLLRFCRRYDERKGATIAAYTLILSLFFWGDHPWLFSGFYNLSIFNDVLPYPSTFALGLSLLALSLNKRPLITSSLVNSTLMVSICSLVLIIHSLTAIFLLVGLSCQQICHQKITLRSLTTLTVMTFGSLALSLLWPYFSMLQLIRVGGDAFHFANEVMYLDVIHRVWPTLMVSPLIVWQALKAKNRDLALMLLALIAIYGLGYFSTKYSYGRTIAFALLIANLLLAQVINQFEQIVDKSRFSQWFKALWLVGLAAIFTFWLQQSTSRLLTVFNSIYLGRPISSAITYRDLNFLAKYTDQYDLIFADVESSWIIPSIAGKVVGTDHPLAFVPGWYVRKWDLMQFYTVEQDQAYRQMILERYHPKFLLIKKALGAVAIKIAAEFSDREKYPLVYEDDKFILLRLR